MSQPPNQPPQGGFGAPHDPRQPAPQQPAPPAQPPQMPPAPPGPPAAPPQQPPAQPGYGYPQAPPQQAPQPGYGYPGQPGQQPGQAGPYGQPQPGPYGQPQQPGPYGQPQPGPYGQQQPGPYGGYSGAPAPGNGNGTGGGPFKGKPAVIIGAALAAVLVIGGGVYLATSGDDGGTKKKPVAGGSNKGDNQDGLTTGGTGGTDDEAGGRDAGDDLNGGRQAGESKVMWLQKNDVDLPRNGSDVYGPWFTDDGLVVKAMYKKISAYNTTDGKEKWSLPLSTQVCAAPVKAADDDKIVLGLKDGTTDRAKCAQLQMVDLKTGKAGWKSTVKKEGAFDILSDITVAISGNTVTAGRTGHSTAFSMTDGKELWGKLPGECQPYAFTSAAKLIAAAACSTGEAAKNHERIQEHDPATGRVKWSYPLAQGWRVDKVYSVDPLVVSATHREKKSWSVISLTDSGNLRSEIDGGKDKFQPQCGGTFIVFGRNLEGCTGVAADADTFYMATADKTSGTDRTNEVVAFDLDTGKPKWRSAAGADRTMMPLRMEGADVVVHMEASYDKGGAVATISPSGGKPRMVLQNPASTAQIENDFFNPKIAYEGGRLYVVNDRVSARNDEEEKETKTIMVFGK